MCGLCTCSFFVAGLHALLSTWNCPRKTKKSILSEVVGRIDPVSSYESICVVHTIITKILRYSS